MRGRICCLSLGAGWVTRLGIALLWDLQTELTHGTEPDSQILWLAAAVLLAVQTWVRFSCV